MNSKVYGIAALWLTAAVAAFPASADASPADPLSGLAAKICDALPKAPRARLVLAGVRSDTGAQTLDRLIEEELVHALVSANCADLLERAQLSRIWEERQKETKAHFDPAEVTSFSAILGADTLLIVRRLQSGDGERLSWKLTSVENGTILRAGAERLPAGLSAGAGHTDASGQVLRIGFRPGRLVSPFGIWLSDSGGLKPSLKNLTNYWPVWIPLPKVGTVEFEGQILRKSTGIIIPPVFVVYLLGRDGQPLRVQMQILEKRIVIRLGDQNRTCGVARFDPWKTPESLPWKLTIHIESDRLRLGSQFFRGACEIASPHEGHGFAGLWVSGSADDGSEKIGAATLAITAR